MRRIETSTEKGDKIEKQHRREEKEEKNNEENTIIKRME